MTYESRRPSPRADVRKLSQRYTVDRQDEEGEAEMDYDDQWPGRLPSTSRRYDLNAYAHGHTRYRVHPSQMQPIPPRRSAQRLTEEPPALPPLRRSRRSGGLFRSHPLVWVGFGMLVMLLAWTGLQALSSWWSLHQDDVTYGRPRTAQYDVVVGHSDSPSSPTHFIAMNLDAEVVVIELPGGDITKAHIYQGPHLFGTGAALYPVTLSFPDVGGKGQPNMDVHVQGQTIIYLNQNGQFVPQGSSSH
ncbi:MAG: hypothetical protein ACRDIV_15595 [Ktedonobacteraceae bacterium]